MHPQARTAEETGFIIAIIKYIPDYLTKRFSNIFPCALLKTGLKPYFNQTYLYEVQIQNKMNHYDNK